jgi:hypothetical protein
MCVIGMVNLYIGWLYLRVKLNPIAQHTRLYSNAKLILVEFLVCSRQSFRSREHLAQVKCECSLNR